MKLEAYARRLARTLWRRHSLNIPRPTFTVKDVRRGRYHRKTNTITLPRWLEDRWTLPRYVEWYVAHELAHAVSNEHNHGRAFQLALARLAPKAWHWECTYKPRAYSQALAIVRR